MNDILRPYQEDISIRAKDLLVDYKICYLAMEVRTGKTLTALAAAEKYGAKNVLFLTKKKAIKSIEIDYEKLKPDFNMVVTNYEAAHLVTDSFDLVILDEAHCLGQFPVMAKRTKLLQTICSRLPIIYLSGTPTPESYSQIYHQFIVSSFSPFKDYKNFYKFANRFVNVKKKYVYNRTFNDYSDAKKDLIDELISHLFLSFTQIEADFVIPVNETILNVEMKEITNIMTTRLKQDRVLIGSSGNEIIADTKVKLMNKLHQLYSGTCLDENGNLLTFDDSKVVFIKNYFAHQKIAIYYKYRAELLLIKDHFKNITDSPEVFNENSTFVFVSQIQSGREGINLSSADAIVMMNIDYSAVSYLQVRARLQYKERTKPANVYWIFSESGIENKIYQKVKNKEDYTLKYFKKDFYL